MSKFTPTWLVERSKRRSEGSIWSKASFLFRLILCVGMLPMIFPESEALMNLRLPNSKTVYSLPLMTHVDLWRGGVHGARISIPIRSKLLPGKSTTAARNVDRIRKQYSNNECSLNNMQSERQSRGFFFVASSSVHWLLFLVATPSLEICTVGILSLGSFFTGSGG